MSDLDGTLLRSDGTLSPATVSFLSTVRAAGIPFTVATARTPRAVRKIAGYEQLGRVVCANGAVVWDAGLDEVLCVRAFVPSALAAAVCTLGAAQPDVGIALLSLQMMYLDQASLALRGKGANGAEIYSDVAVTAARDPIAMVAVRHPRLSAAALSDPVRAAFAGTGTASFAGPSVVDVAAGSTTKAVAAASELAGAGYDATESVVFGDMPNDLPLFAWSGWGCAVANAHPSVLRAADEIVPSNDDDGVARTVARLFGL